MLQVRSSPKSFLLLKQRCCTSYVYLSLQESECSSEEPVFVLVDFAWPSPANNVSYFSLVPIFCS